MKVLVIGSGGREHAIVWKLNQGKNAGKIYCAPGNAGINKIAEPVNIKQDDIGGLIKFVKDNKIGFTVVGPEAPLAIGIVDEFEKEGLKIFGTSKSAARLENSKVFAKDFMKRHGIPTAQYVTFSAAEKSKAVEHLKSSKYPVVIKADGLAAGKGVVISENFEQASEQINEFFENKIFGAAGEHIVIEEYLTGVEASVFAICDGENYIVLPPAQDHKKIGNGETGKNTGGMGTYAPANKIVTNEVLERVKKRIIEPVLKYMKSEGSKFKGVLYSGIMIDSSGNPFVIEFNTRFGDPETQVVLPLVKSDLLEMFISASEGTLNNYKLEIYSKHYACVVMASKGYPDKYETGKEISGLDSIGNDGIVFHAGTKESADGKILSGGGRVLNVVGFSDADLSSAIDAAYRNVKKIKFENEYYRTDIGSKGL